MNTTELSMNAKLELANELAVMFAEKFPNQYIKVSKGALGAVFLSTALTDAEHIKQHHNGIIQNDVFHNTIMLCDVGQDFELDFCKPTLSCKSDNKMFYCQGVAMKGLRKPKGNKEDIKKAFAKFLDKRKQHIADNINNILNVDKIPEKFFKFI